MLRALLQLKTSRLDPDRRDPGSGAALRGRSVPIVRTLACLIILATVAGSQVATPAAKTVTIGGPFTLTSGDGTTVTEATYHGKWLLVFFGYTSCPDLCPTTLMDVAGALQHLGTDADKLQPIFITVDPDHDTPQVMGQYAAAFDPRIAGLSGTPQQIAAVADAYGAYGQPREVDPAGGERLVDHSTYLYVMDREGRFVRGLSYDTPGEQIADTLREIMARP